jgi:hypothetical protein
LRGWTALAETAVLQVILQFCSRFELQYGGLGELNVAAEVVGVKDGFNVAQTVAGEAGDLRHGGTGDGQPYDRGSLKS